MHYQHQLSLPQDVLLCVCEELANQQDFGSLFNCARAGRSLASIALSWLYRIHHLSPVISSEGSDAELTKNQDLEYKDRISKQNKIVAMWALQWKSVIASSLQETLYPYGLYIRALDLRNLSDLLEEPQFRNVAMDSFFAGGMVQFMKSQETPMKRKKRGKAVYTRLNIPSILEAVGESITNFVTETASQNHSTVALEDLAGEINSLSLSRWTGRLSKLRSLTLLDGGALDESVAKSIANNCFNFDDLTFKNFGEGKDPSLASFFSALRPNTLRSFTALSANGVGPQTLLALNHHSSSLKVLKLDGLDSIGIKSLNLLQGCTSLEGLDLVADKTAAFIDLKATENNIFLEVVNWLRKCEQLCELSIGSLTTSPSILTEVCLCNNIRLRKLAVSGYLIADNQDFHRALSHQTSLEHLDLKADPEGGFRDDIEMLIYSISKLTKLKSLNLLNDTSIDFRTHDIQSLMTPLKSLEELTFHGWDVNDGIWRSLAGLKSLRALNILAVSSFTLDGILAFISTLKETNNGMNLMVMNQMPTHGLSGDEQDIIRKTIDAKVNGTFDYVLWKDPDDDSDSESASD